MRFCLFLLVYDFKWGFWVCVCPVCFFGFQNIGHLNGFQMSAGCRPMSARQMYTANAGGLPRPSTRPWPLSHWPFPGRILFLAVRHELCFFSKRRCTRQTLASSRAATPLAPKWWRAALARPCCTGSERSLAKIWMACMFSFRFQSAFSCWLLFWGRRFVETLRAFRVQLAQQIVHELNGLPQPCKQKSIGLGRRVPTKCKWQTSD